MSMPPQPPQGQPGSDPYANQRQPPVQGQGDQPQQFSPGQLPPMMGSQGFDQPNPPPQGRSFKFTRLGIFALIGALALGFFAYQSYKLSSKSKATPTQMTLSQLMTDGPGDNLYLELQDVFLLDQPAVIETRRRNEDRWSKIWIDASPSVEAGMDMDEMADELDAADMQQLQQALGMVGGRMPGAKPAGARNVVVVFDDVSNEAEYADRCSASTYTGMVMNDIRSLDSETAELLAEDIPGFDRDQTLIFEVGETPASAGKIMLFVGLAAVCLVVAAFGFFPKG